MLDVNYIRDNLKEVSEMLEKRRVVVDLAHILEIDEERRKLIKEVEELRRERREIAAKKEIEKGKKIKGELSKKEAALSSVEAELLEYMEQVPNILSPDVPKGEGEEDNVEIKKWGKSTEFDFEPKDHVDLGKSLGIIDQERAAKISGRGFYFMIGLGAKLEFVLAKWAINFLSEKDYMPVITPSLVRKQFVEGTGYLPRREEPDVYKIEGEDLYLIATAEIPLAGLHSDETIEIKNLPLNYAGFSSCFRKEAGTYGKYTHGIFRVHEFDKVEIFKFVKPSESGKAFEEIISLQEEICQALEIPYRVVNICSGEMSAPAYLKYDLEYWDPVSKTYRELTSASNTTDYQARRLNIRYREGNETKYVHTLNGTAIALSRTIIALLENHQQKDGSIKLPKALHEYMGQDTIQR
jgi:seryl-tRNA synthetase